MQLYQKIGKIKDEKEILKFEEELRDRFGPLPPVTKNLIYTLQIKLIARDTGICSISENYNMIRVVFSSFYPLTPKKKEIIRIKFSNMTKTFPQDERTLLIYKPEKKNKEEFLIWLRGFLQKLKDVLI